MMIIMIIIIMINNNNNNNEQRGRRIYECRFFGGVLVCFWFVLFAVKMRYGFCQRQQGALC